MFRYESMSHIDGNLIMRCVRGVDADWCGD